MKILELLGALVEAVLIAAWISMFGIGVAVLLTTVAFAGTTSDPYSGAPIVISATPGALTEWQAEDFDKGGEGVAYHDNVPGNNGAQYRPLEDMDIVAGPAGVPFLVHNFETGEWLQYTIEVKETGSYYVELHAATDFSKSAYHIEVDGKSYLGAVVERNGWTTYAWLGRSPEFALVPGVHRLRIVCDEQYFNLNAIRLKLSSQIVFEWKPVRKVYP